MLDLIIIGAGPFGISLAAHAQASGLSYKLLGYPMDFWKNQMPQNMFIRTPHDFVSLSDPNDAYTIHRFAEETGEEAVTPLPRTVFVKYAMWFAEKAGVEFTPQLAAFVEKKDGAFHVTTEAGDTLQARNAVIATGVEHYRYIPDLLQNLPSHLYSHTSGYTSFAAFQGKSVAVIGSGQSAWEAAGLLHMEGAKPELLYRRAAANYSGSYEEEIALRDLGNDFYDLPLAEKQDNWGQSPGSVAHFLRPYVEGKVPETGNVTLAQLEATEDGRVRLHLSNGEERIVDHVISASGFHINLDKVPFLSDAFKAGIEREAGYPQFPKLDRHFQAGVPGLYFAGPLSSHSHGPTFRFILGLKKTASTIIPNILAAKDQASA